MNEPLLVQVKESKRRGRGREKSRGHGRTDGRTQGQI